MSWPAALTVITPVVCLTVIIVAAIRHPQKEPENNSALKLVAREDTLFKIHRALKARGMDDLQIEHAVNAMQSEGIYFREAE